MKPDPRIFEKNFAMPMNPGTGQEMGAVSPPERRDGLPFPKPREFAPGAASPQPVQSTVRPREINDVPPLFTTLIRKSDGTRAVTVSEGCVTEIIPKSDAGGGGTVDGVKEWPIDNIWTGNLLTEHGPITVNQAVGIAFDVDAAGFITGNGMIEIRDVGAEQKSIHYAPKVGPTAGTAGDVFVVLAILTGTGDSERLTIKHGGSNWPHYHDLLPFVKATDSTGVDIFDQFDKATGEYRYLGVRGPTTLEDPDQKITVTIAGKDILIDWADGPNLDLELKTYTLKQGPLQSTEATITIPEKTVQTDIVLAHSHNVTLDATISPDAGHFHNLEQHQHDTAVAGILLSGTQPPFSRTGSYNFSTDEFVDDGAHTHAIAFDSSESGESGSHFHTVTIPEETVAVTIAIPGAIGIEPDTDYSTVCFRDRLYHSTVSGSGNAVPHVGAKTTKTIWSPNMSGGLDLSSESTPTIATI